MRCGGVPFLDLARQHEEIGEEVLDALERLLRSGRFVLGPEVEAFENEFAAYCGCRAGIGVASGTDAITLALKALGAGPGDEVVTAAFSAPPTAVAISLAGAVPVFADIDPDSRTIDPGLVAEAVSSRTRFLVIVHLYGRMARMPELMQVAERLGLVVIEDCAQAHGASLQGRKAGSWGHAGCYSFYPTKNLGAYGDGGMVVAGDEELATRLHRLRDYGRGDRDRLEEIGLNSRLDELQAALLRIKLGRLETWNRRRRLLAGRYLEGLADLPLALPAWDGEENHCFHLFVVESDDREALRAHLDKRGIGTGIHYSVPLHLQGPYLPGGSPPAPCPVSERLAKRALSLPLFPQMSESEQEQVIAAIREFFHA